MRKRQQGFQLIEITIVLALIGLASAMTVPDLLRTTARQRVLLGASELAGALQLARHTAVKMSANVGVKFRTAEDGSVTFTLHRDGDGDGVLNADIDSGADPAIGLPRRLTSLGPRVGFGFPPPPAPFDPGDPHRRLTRLDDPIRFNQSDIASFSSLGAATPGTLYVTDHRHELAAVRVFNRTGRVRILVYDRDHERWQRKSGV